MLFGADETTHAAIVGGGYALFGGLIVWILKSALPAILREHKESLEKKDADCAKEREIARIDRKEENAMNRQTNANLTGAIDKLADEVASASRKS